MEIKDTFKYLGLLIDSNLDVDYVSLQISQLIGIIARRRHFVPKITLERIYFGLIHPYLKYDIAIWGQANKTILNSLLTLQKRVVRLIHFANC